MAYWGLPAPDSTKEEEHKDRDTELENILGNLLVAKYQVARLEDKLTNRVGNGNKDSTFLFKHGERWYKVIINIEKEEHVDNPEEEETKLDQSLESTP
jgi:hypothetical protein